MGGWLLVVASAVPDDRLSVCAVLPPSLPALSPAVPGHVRPSAVPGLAGPSGLSEPVGPYEDVSISRDFCLGKQLSFGADVGDVLCGFCWCWLEMLTLNQIR